MVNLEKFMKAAIEEAEIAALNGDVPVGAVIVKDGEILAKAHNRREADKNALSHAEVCAISRANELLGSWHLDGCELYVTLEPCPMCAGAIINSRIKRVVYGACDARAGACGSLINLNHYPFNHKFEVVGGVLEQECSKLLSDFFKDRRNKSNEN